MNPTLQDRIRVFDNAATAYAIALRDLADAVTDWKSARTRIVAALAAKDDTSGDLIRAAVLDYYRAELARLEVVTRAGDLIDEVEHQHNALLAACADTIGRKPADGGAP